MAKKLHPFIETRIKRHQPRTAQALLLAVREIVQEISLLGLARSGFFQHAAFHGGTALRIIHGLDRFSEDLDFCLHKPDPEFELGQMLHPLKEEMESWGLTVEITARSKVEDVVKKAFLKESSLGALLSLEVPIHPQQKCTLKLEVDSNPPASAQIESKLCEFPTDFYVTCHDLSSMFAGKMHALLTRNYIKGRDWYDLIFYLSRRTTINLPFLRNALLQRRTQDLLDLPETITLDWVVAALRRRLGSLDMAAVVSDVTPFVQDVSALKVWSERYFLDKLERYCDDVKRA